MRLGPAYRPRQVEQTALFRLLTRHLDSFTAHVENEGRTLPDFVRAELEGFLRCGVLEYGFARAVCDHCGEQRLVPFSCQGRGFCPSCCGRRMADTAARLADQVFPAVPVRHWVLSLPHPLRYMLAFDAQLLGTVLGIFVGEIFRWLRQTTRQELDLPAGARLHGGSVTAIHRADSAAKLNPHFHSAAFDGVYVQREPDGPLTFHATRAPTRGDIAQVAWATCNKTLALLKRRGLASDASPEDLDPLHGSEPLLSECAAASLQGVVLIGARAGHNILRLHAPIDGEEPLPPRAAHGFDVHAARRVSAQDRKGLERLCRYILRPPISHDRLTLTDDGRVRLRLKRPWSDDYASHCTSLVCSGRWQATSGWPLTGRGR